MKVFGYIGSGICNVGNIYKFLVINYNTIMHAKEVSTFLNNDYADSALYINFRSMPSVMDAYSSSSMRGNVMRGAGSEGTAGSGAEV